ncbi:hypothetical protein L210DRAFT_674044 [Boletus edulis BED1]|uniref:Uncharacterized protein n=1 Tax=Boletus edulis BED1 TaxID=1328754 RepID=A0AAD4BYG0_BOLED|nr:hypothetical protein L210DRAFT_674044 [Boletus edulis BED1]
MLEYHYLSADTPFVVLGLIFGSSIAITGTFFEIHCQWHPISVRISAVNRDVNQVLRGITLYNKQCQVWFNRVSRQVPLEGACAHLISCGASRIEIPGQDVQNATKQKRHSPE